MDKFIIFCDSGVVDMGKSYLYEQAKSIVMQMTKAHGKEYFMLNLRTKKVLKVKTTMEEI